MEGGVIRELRTLVARKTLARMYAASTYAPRQERRRLRLVATDDPNVTRRARAATSPDTTPPDTHTDRCGDHGGDRTVPIYPLRVARAAVPGHIHAAQPARISGAARPTPSSTLTRVPCLPATALRTP